MITDFAGFIETEETVGEQAIRAMHEAEASEKAFGDDLQEIGKALLETVRHLLTGREMQVCEAAADIENSEGVDVACMTRLQNQFAREIAAWKDGVRA